VIKSTLLEIIHSSTRSREERWFLVGDIPLLCG